ISFSSEPVNLLIVASPASLISSLAIKLEMQMNNKLTILAVVHICRFENGKIAEFWDIGQIQPDPLVNENGMF
ncbi:hypothetical protein L1Y69_11750, partial [Acinetobacter baumannii]|nr:hypothetical protein [Acinetobacter baumannii]